MNIKVGDKVFIKKALSVKYGMTDDIWEAMRSNIPATVICTDDAFFPDSISINHPYIMGKACFIQEELELVYFEEE